MKERREKKIFLYILDFSFKKYKVAVFADGDFWHGKDWDKRKNKLGANPAFWFDKIERNLERDFKVNKKRCEDGWTVLRFWESDIKKNIDGCVEKVLNAIAEAKGRQEKEKQLAATYHKKITIPNECAKNIVEEYLSSPLPFQKKSLKSKAVKKTKELLQYKYPEENITKKVAEDILKYAAPKKPNP